MCSKNQTPVEWLVVELLKKDILYITSLNFEEFKIIVQKAQQLETERLKKVKTHQYIKFSFSLN